MIDPFLFTAVQSGDESHPSEIPGNAADDVFVSPDRQVGVVVIFVFFDQILAGRECFPAVAESLPDVVVDRKGKRSTQAVSGGEEVPGILIPAVFLENRVGDILTFADIAGKSGPVLSGHRLGCFSRKIAGIDEAIQ